MGNDQSNIPDIDIVEKAVEVCDFWTQHSAAIFDRDYASYLTVFIGELFVNGTLWTSQTPLEKNAKHLMIYRHPCIVKYISSWQRNSKFHLAVEEVSPLAQEISKLNFLQISIGLHSVLKALDFLHINAGVSHNNICTSSIYVSKEGNWKLGGMEYLCKYKDLTSDYLNKTRSNRYSKSLDPNEKVFQNSSNRKDCVDVYAFGVLAADILKSVKAEDGSSSLSSFIVFCKNDLLNTDVTKRPTFKSILEHDFFNHQFIAIHSFLLELPLKSDDEKIDFFQDLLSKLFEFEEEVVASQLSELLLSRMVFLNKTAQVSLLPFLLTPRTDLNSEDKLFSMETFKMYLCPKLIEIFKVRDREIRWYLLSFFPKYVDAFTKEELQNKILPELLVGIKDTDDQLVSLTLQTLAILVPVLGSATVIGGKRAKLFTDGRPTHSNNIKSFPLLPTTSTQLTLEETDRTELNNVSELPERPRPDGEEGETSTDEIEPSVNEDLDNWEDWDVNEARNEIVNIDVLNENQIESTVLTSRNKPNIPDILQLDIKNQAFDDNDEFNFFQDMEPIINNSNTFVVDKNLADANADTEFSKKLTLNVEDAETNADWDEDDWD